MLGLFFHIHPSSLASIFCIMLMLLPSWSFGSDTINGFGKLKFGMTPDEVKTLPDCSTSTECLFEIAGKNRYFTLSYQPPFDPNVNYSTSKANTSPSLLSRIMIDMGAYSEDWYTNLYRGLSEKYPLTHDLTKETDRRFRAGEVNELPVGFAQGQIILEIFRRPFGNFIIRVVYQNEQEAERSLANLELSSTSTHH